MHPVAHWSFKLTNPAVALPLGTEHFKAAERCLDARTLFHHEIGPDLRACACVACAGDAIQKLAVEYNTNRLLNEGAPRSKDVQNEFNAVLEASDKLLKALLGMNDYSRKAFEPYSANLDLPVYLGYFDDEADPPSYDAYSDFDSEFVRNLVAVRNAAEVACAEYKERREKPTFADRGGNTNLFKEEHGSPDSNLVRNGWIVFETFQPGKARGTVINGAFHEFLGHVYGYATGQDPENYSGLDGWIKALAGLLRQRQDCLGEEIALAREMRALEAINPDHPFAASDLRSRLDVVGQKLKKIERAIQDARQGKKLAIS
jgi:hypothetical protein